MQPLVEPGATWRDFLVYWQACLALRCLVRRVGWSMCQPPRQCSHAGKGSRCTAVVGAPGFTLRRQYVSLWGGVQLLPERKLTSQRMMPYSTQLDASGMALGVVVPQPSRVGTLQLMDSCMGPQQCEMAWLGPGGLMHHGNPGLAVLVHVGQPLPLHLLVSTGGLICHGNQGFGCTCRPIPPTPLVGFWTHLPEGSYGHQRAHMDIGGLIQTLEGSYGHWRAHMDIGGLIQTLEGSYEHWR